MIFKIILCILVLILMPILLGLYFIKANGSEKNNLLFAFIMGYLVEFAVFQIMAVPMIFMHCQFTTLLYAWTAVMVLFCIVSIFLNRKDFQKASKVFWQNLKTLPKLSVIAIVLIGLQLYVPFAFMYLNNDDSQYVAMSTTAIHTNTLMDYIAYTGAKYTNVPAKRALSPFQLYLAVMGELVQIEPAIFAHTVFPMVLIFMGYLVYIFIAKKILKLKPDQVALFLIFISVINIFGDYSEYTQFTFFLKRVWQGKALVAGIFVPLAFLLFFDGMKQNQKKDWLALLLLMFSAALASTMGDIILPITLGLLSLLFTIKNRKISYFVKSAICCLPCIVYALIYFCLK